MDTREKEVGGYVFTMAKEDMLVVEGIWREIWNIKG